MAEEYAVGIRRDDRSMGGWGRMEGEAGKEAERIVNYDVDGVNRWMS